MSNPLLPFVNSVIEVTAYQRVRQQLGQDHNVFLAMSRVAQKRGFAFDVPLSPAEYSEKHEEIEQYLSRYRSMLNRQGLFFELMEELLSQLRVNGQDIHVERLLKLVELNTNRGFLIKLSREGTWLMEWSVAVDVDETSDSRDVFAVVFKGGWENIVPWFVAQYLHSGILLYKHKAHATALALMSIAVEATLRDVLSTKGYGHVPRASKVDIYKDSSAQIDASVGFYTVTFLDPMLKSPADLSTSAGGSVPIDIQIRRVVNLNNARVDLLIKAPHYLIDHWSSDKVAQAGQSKSISGLGEALQVARDIERVITPLDLPTDVDQVLTAVRNNLIHLSNDSLDEELPRYASMSATGRFTVRDFVNEPTLVFDLITDIPRFVNEQYVKLWRAGVKI